MRIHSSGSFFPIPATILANSLSFMSTTGTAAAAAPCLRHASYLLLSLATLAKDEGRIVVGNLHSVDTIVIGLPVPGLGLHHSKLTCVSRRQT